MNKSQFLLLTIILKFKSLVHVTPTYFPPIHYPFIPNQMFLHLSTKMGYLFPPLFFFFQSLLLMLCLMKSIIDSLLFQIKCSLLGLLFSLLPFKSPFQARIHKQHGKTHRNYWTKGRKPMLIFLKNGLPNLKSLPMSFLSYLLNTFQTFLLSSFALFSFQ